MRKVKIIKYILGIIIGICGHSLIIAPLSASECAVQLHKEPPSNLPELWDDGALWQLAESIDNSLNYYKRQQIDDFALTGALPFSQAHLHQTLIAFQKLLSLNLSVADLLDEVQRNFTFYSLSFAGNEPHVLVTGYFEPELRGSLEKKETYVYPIYTLPPDLMSGSNGRVWRQQERMLYPYWSRQEIDDDHVLKGAELVYLNDPVQAFILHVQGSGRIRLNDGSVKRVRYAGNNGKAYKSIGRLLVDEGKMALEDVTLPSIITYLNKHPEEKKRILYHNERYIFFSWNEQLTPDQGPLGNIAEPLVAGRSVALDNRCYPQGILGYLHSEQPRFDKNRLKKWVSLKRFVVNQDTGSAIRGPYRLDYFLGNGSYAKNAAGIMKQPGQFYILLVKM